MSSSTSYHKFLEAFACAHVSDGFTENGGDRMLDFFMNMQGSPQSALTEVRELKDTGNGFFRQKEFDMAAACYDEACKLLSLSLGNLGGEDIQSLSDLAVSLISNMAACALKLEEYKAAAGMCSMILDTFPRNVKALFRRAIAYMKLKRFLLAKLDLVEALVVEPCNKDVLRELDVVKGHLLIKENGKRVLEDGIEDAVDEKNKKPIHTLTSDMDVKDSESVITEVMEDETDASIKENESVNMEVTEPQSICVNKSALEFSKKGGGSSRLRIPVQSYKKLLEGKEVCFYRKRDLSSLTIRILKCEVTKEGENIRDRCKRKKRRRRPKKWKAKMMGAMNEDMASSDFINVKSATTCGSLNESSTTVTSSTSSVCDNFSLPSTHIPEDNTRGVVNDLNALVNEKATSFCSPAQVVSSDHQPFIFSARPKKCKIYSLEKPSCPLFTHMPCRYPSGHHVHEKWRMAISKKKHRQGDESPRHNLSTSSRSRSLSHKFLRPRGVSVSCCRYSPEAQLTKKRKEVLACLASSDRPQKKPFFFVNPTLSLMSFSNYVIINPDSESRVCTM